MSEALRVVLIAVMALGSLSALLAASNLVATRKGPRGRRILLLLLSLTAVGAAVVVRVTIGPRTVDRMDLRIDAIRATTRDAPAVDLSIWVYSSSGEELGRVFTSGKLVPSVAGTRWVEISEHTPIHVPLTIAGDEERVSVIIKLNPNRFMTPADAQFTVSIEGPDLAGSADGESTHVVRSDDPGEFELRLRLTTDLGSS